MQTDYKGSDVGRTDLRDLGTFAQESAKLLQIAGVAAYSVRGIPLLHLKPADKQGN
jgi:hypothetical protein